MTSSAAASVESYLAELPEARREVVSAVREAVRSALPAGVEERVNWGMISYEIPLDRYPTTYNSQPLMFAAIAAQKNHFSLYLTSVYMNQKLTERLREGFATAGQKLDMGKSCIRFRKLEGIPLDVISEVVGALTVEEFIGDYEESRRK